MAGCGGALGYPFPAPTLLRIEALMGERSAYVAARLVVDEGSPAPGRTKRYFLLAS